MRVEFSLKQQLVDNLYPQFGIAVPAGTLIGRLYLPKAHQYRNTPSPFAGKVAIVYDSWKSNGFAGWTHKYNPVRVVEFILKPGVNAGLWLDVVKHFAASNLESVRKRTKQLLEQILDHTSQAIDKLKQVASTAIVKVQTVVAEFVAEKPQPQPVKSTLPLLPTQRLNPVVSADNIRDFIGRLLKPVALLLPAREDYDFTKKYKPQTYKRLTKSLNLKTELNKDNAIDTLISQNISPQAIKQALRPGRKN